MKISKIITILCCSSLIFLTGCSSNSTENNLTESKMPQLMPAIETITVEESTARIQTNYGEIIVELYPDKTPETYKNFKTLAEEKKYNGVIFHRVIKDFMIQTGDFERANGTGGYSYKGPGTKFEDEIDPELTHKYGTLSMANAGPNTNGSQFFIVQAQNGTPWLDGKHSVFGQVTEGFEVLEAIAALETDYMDRPITE